MTAVVVRPPSSGRVTFTPAPQTGQSPDLPEPRSFRLSGSPAVVRVPGCGPDWYYQVTEAWLGGRTRNLVIPDVDRVDYSSLTDVDPVTLTGPTSDLDAEVANLIPNSSAIRTALDAHYARAGEAVKATPGLTVDALTAAGITGDGTADDTGALNTLVDSIASFGGEVLLAQHALTGPLMLPAGVTVRGRNGNSRLSLPAGADFPAIIADAAAGSKVANLKVTAVGPTAVGACAVSVRGDTSDVVLEDVTADGTFEGFRIEGGAGATPGTVRRITLSRCHARNVDQYGYRVDDCDGVELAHCTSVVSGLDGVKLRKLTRNVVLTGGYFTGATGGDGLDAYAGGDTFTINGGVYSGNSINGITIKTDDLNKTDPGGFGHVRNVTISGVHADGNGGNGLAVHRNAEADDVTEPLVVRVTVAGGTFNANAGRGVFVRARQVTLQSPMCARNGLEGIDVQAGSVDVALISPQVAGNSTTIANARDGIRVAGRRVQIQNGSSLGADPDGATSDADVAAGTRTQRFGLRVESSAAEVIVAGISLKHNVTAPFSDASGTAFILPGYSDDATWPQIALPNNKRIYTRTPAGGFSSALYMTTGGALNVGDSSNAAVLNLLSAGTVDVFPQLRALGGVKLGSLTADPTLTKGAGTPEGAVAAPPGSLRVRTDPGEGAAVYVKESGSSSAGWNPLPRVRDRGVDAVAEFGYPVAESIATATTDAYPLGLASAVAAVPGTGGALFLRRGVHRTDTRLFVKQGTALSGEGPEATTLYVTGTAFQGAVSDVLVRDLTIQGDNASLRQVFQGLATGGQRNWRFENVRFVNIGVSLGRVGATMTDGSTLTSGCGIDEHIEFDGCEFTGWLEDGCVWARGAHHVTVNRCQVHNLGTDTTKGDAVKFSYGARHGRVLHSDFYDLARDAVDLYDAHSVDVIGNTMTDVAVCAVEAKWQDGGPNAVSRIRVHDNTAVNCETAGGVTAPVFQLAVPDLSARGNVVDGTPGVGFRSGAATNNAAARSKAGTWLDNRAYACTGDGFVLNGTDLHTIRGNVARDGSARGFNVPAATNGTPLGGAGDNVSDGNVTADVWMT